MFHPGSDVRRLFAYNIHVGYSRRREDREIAEYIRKSEERIAGMTLGQLCAANMIKLDVACHCCPRRGRYTITRLIDRHGTNMLLSNLKSILAVDCGKHGHTGVFNRCGCYFPGVRGKA